jgi:hypothetical protein
MPTAGPRYRPVARLTGEVASRTVEIGAFELADELSAPSGSSTIRSGRSRRRTGLRRGRLGRSGDDAVGAGDQEQVEDAGLDRDRQRAEDDREQQQREADDDADEQRQLVPDRLGEVDSRRRELKAQP